MTLVCELPGILEDINTKNELINYGDAWRKIHSKPPPPLNPDLVASTIPSASADKSSKRGDGLALLRTTTQTPNMSSSSGRNLHHAHSEPSLTKGAPYGDFGTPRSHTDDEITPTLSITPAYLPTLIAQRHTSRPEPLPARTAPSKRRRPPLNHTLVVESVPPAPTASSSAPPDEPARAPLIQEGEAIAWGSESYDLPLATLFPSNSVQMSVARHFPDTRVPNRLHQSHSADSTSATTLSQREEEELRLLQQKKAAVRTEKQQQMEAQQLLLLRQLQVIQEQQRTLLQQFHDLQVSYQQDFHMPLQLPANSPLPQLPPLVLPQHAVKRFPHLVVGANNNNSASSYHHHHGHSYVHHHTRASSSPSFPPVGEAGAILAYPILKARHTPLPRPNFHPVYVPPKDSRPKDRIETFKPKGGSVSPSTSRISISPSTSSKLSTSGAAPLGSKPKAASERTLDASPASDAIGGKQSPAAAASNIDGRRKSNSRDSTPQRSSSTVGTTSAAAAAQAQQQVMHTSAHQQQRYQAQMAQQQAQAQAAAAAAAAAQQEQQHQQQQQQQYSGRARLVFFTQHNDGPIPTIHKDVGHVHVPRESGLSRLFAIVEVYVFVPHRKKPLVLRVPQTTNFGQLSAVAIKTRNSTPKLPPHRRLEENPDAYYVRIAGRNGQPDERYPGVLSKRNGNIESWLRYAFCLVENPEYKARMAVQPQEQKVHLTVFLPSGSYNVLLVDASTKMKKVLQMICAKRQLTAANFMLMVEHMSWESDSQSESDVGEVEWQSIPGSVRVGDLESTAVTLVQKTGAATLQGEEAWYTGFAAQSKTYSHIIYLKKKNLGSSSKEESASLDIDQDAITVTVIRKKRQPKTFKILFENILAVHQSEAKPTQFHVECPRPDHRTFVFEAPNPVMAKEILFRIQFLIDMENEARALALANPV